MLIERSKYEKRGKPVRERNKTGQVEGGKRSKLKKGRARRNRG